jgi:hypothetical protein
MDQRLHVVTIITADLVAARAVSRDGLGWIPLLDVPSEIIFAQAPPRWV